MWCRWRSFTNSLCGSRGLRLARRIAQTDPWALRLAKRAVNHTMDTMGFSNAIESCFDMHHLGTRVRSRPPRAGPS